jgi:hypothetical protein
MSKIDDFLNRYRIRNIQVNKEYKKIDYNRYYNQSHASYYADREESLDIEMDRSSFEALVNLDSKYEDLADRERHEQWIRKENPAVADAYHKYRMLLELYR